uniref:hypothetical protein n=1 Tax=Thaumasiovibrio occultus TaxID=1891184 RepID=UPI000B3513DA|nr:hypothetical protein [Thaumasiovibrio occultus]
MPIYLIAALAGMIAIVVWRHYRKLQRIAHQRGKPSLSSFTEELATHSPSRTLSPAVINAVFEATQQWLNRPFPVSAFDSFDDTYQMDTDDLEELYGDIANTLGIDASTTNLTVATIETVQDLVLLLDAQANSD